MKKIVCILLMLLLLCGCNSEKPEDGETVPEITKESLQQALDDAMAAADEDADTVPAYLTELDKRVGWKVLRVEDTGDGTASAKVKVSAPDLYSVIRSLENETFASAEEMDAAVTEGVRKADLRERELTVDFQLDGSRWEALLSEEFTDACYGGLLTYREELYAALEGA